MDNGVDVSHDQPFKEHHGYRRECYRSVVIYTGYLSVLATGIMVVCLKHVGITDSDRERLKMSVKTLAKWSAHACSTRPGNPSDPAAL